MTVAATKEIESRFDDYIWDFEGSSVIAFCMKCLRIVTRDHTMQSTQHLYKNCGGMVPYLHHPDKQVLLCEIASRGIKIP